MASVQMCSVHGCASPTDRNGTVYVLVRHNVIMGGENNDFLFKAILCILINNENSSGKRFVFLSQDILPFRREGSSPSFL